MEKSDTYRGFATISLVRCMHMDMCGESTADTMVDRSRRFSPPQKQMLTPDESEQPLQTATVRSGSVQSPARLGPPWRVPLSLTSPLPFAALPQSVIVRLWPCSDDADERGCVMDLGGVHWTTGLLPSRAADLAVCSVLVLASLLSAASARPRSNVGSRPGELPRLYKHHQPTQVTVQAKQASSA
jgi:hypothetical protein